MPLLYARSLLLQRIALTPLQSVNVKHLKYVPFPSIEVDSDMSSTPSPMDMDVNMDIDLERIPFHTRLPSSASSMSSSPSVENMSRKNYSYVVNS